MNIGSILYGISLGWNSVFESLYQIFDDKWFSWTFLLASLGAALTCVIAGIFRSRFGTKFAIFVFSIPNLIGWLLLILVDNSVAVSRHHLNFKSLHRFFSFIIHILDNLWSLIHRIIGWCLLPDHSNLHWWNGFERNPWNALNFVWFGY